MLLLYDARRGCEYSKGGLSLANISRLTELEQATQEFRPMFTLERFSCLPPAW